MDGAGGLAAIGVGASIVAGAMTAAGESTATAEGGLAGGGPGTLVLRKPVKPRNRDSPAKKRAIAGIHYKFPNDVPNGMRLVQVWRALSENPRPGREAVKAALLALGYKLDGGKVTGKVTGKSLPKEIPDG
jgi:hypothetical protein